MISKSDLKLDDWQEEFLKTKGDKILCCGRQIGKSVICGIDAGEWAAHNSNKTILMIAPTERQARGLFEKTLDYLAKYYPQRIMKGKNRPTMTRIKLTRNVIIWCLPTGLSGLGIRFLTIDRLYEDESSRIPEAVQSAVTPMLLTTGGDTIKLSTPYGTKGHFWDTLSNKDGAYNSFTRFDNLDSESVLRRRKICKTWTQKQFEKAMQKIEQARARMSNLEFAQEYLGKALADLRQVFPDELLIKQMVLKRRPTVIKGRRYYLGNDIARMGEDVSSFEIVDKINKKKIEQVESITTKHTRLTETAKLNIQLDSKYNFKAMMLDDGGMGVGVYDILLDCEQTRRKVKATYSADRPLTRDEKKRKRVIIEDMYNNMLMLLERGYLQLLDDPAVFQSLKSVQYEITDGGKIRYMGEDKHIADGLIRAVWLAAKDKTLEIYKY